MTACHECKTRPRVANRVRCERCLVRKRAYDKRYESKAASREMRKERLRSTPSTQAEKERDKARQKRNRTVSPEKARARQLVTQAIRRGDMVPSMACDTCKQVPPPARDGRRTLQAHHADYAKPLAVEWLCVSCHHSEHRARGGK